MHTVNDVAGIDKAERLDVIVSCKRLHPEEIDMFWDRTLNDRIQLGEVPLALPAVLVVC